MMIHIEAICDADLITHTPVFFYNTTQWTIYDKHQACQNVHESFVGFKTNIAVVYRCLKVKNRLKETNTVRTEYKKFW